jgi:hypothetical protein
MRSIGYLVDHLGFRAVVARMRRMNERERIVFGEFCSVIRSVVKTEARVELEIGRTE